MPITTIRYNPPSSLAGAAAKAFWVNSLLPILFPLQSNLISRQLPKWISKKVNQIISLPVRNLPQTSHHTPDETGSPSTGSAALRGPVRLIFQPHLLPLSPLFTLLKSHSCSSSNRRNSELYTCFTLLRKLLPSWLGHFPLKHLLAHDFMWNLCFSVLHYELHEVKDFFSFTAVSNIYKQCLAQGRHTAFLKWRSEHHIKVRQIKMSSSLKCFKLKFESLSM